ncbi:hypothetical protein J559_1171 [Acinetobacter sp. 983759]|nr:hypothetical protein J546_0300 [Acinetobacter sp. 1461402]EXB73592.1 hypothetical protein J550_0860 [Acinetobacter sp. 230853]EXC34788.1 hypothetical protein J520_0063 [Acinetobacter sp. 869535]EXE14780.1 hypothetical protein J559_1171 [Acinetobacter sp. 983759]
MHRIILNNLTIYQLLLCAFYKKENLINNFSIAILPIAEH